MFLVVSLSYVHVYNVLFFRCRNIILTYHWSVDIKRLKSKHEEQLVLYCSRFYCDNRVALLIKT